MRSTAAYLEGLEPSAAIIIGELAVRARPISAECARRFDVEIASQDSATRALAIARVMRAAFPKPSQWYYRFRDPLRAIVQLPGDTQAALLRKLLSVPGGKPADDPDSIVDRIIASHRAAVHGPESSNRVVSKETITRMTQIWCGAQWYFNRERWTTVDGYVPWAECVMMYEALETARAQQRLSDFAAHKLAQGGPEVMRLYNETMKTANPLET